MTTPGARILLPRLREALDGGAPIRLDRITGNDHGQPDGEGHRGDDGKHGARRHDGEGRGRHHDRRHDGRRRDDRRHNGDHDGGGDHDGSGGGDGDTLPAPEGTAVVLRTSGSTTGTGRAVALSADALIHSAMATYEHLSGPGQWLLAIPADHIAGIQVLVRSILSGHDPVLAAPGRFDPGSLAVSIRSMRTDVPRYLSLVPTQLHRALAAGPGVTTALASCAAVLVGGAASSPELLDRARAAGIAVVSTYGMTETSGGCVYDGVPLEGVQVRVDAGRVYIAGPVLATGYLDGSSRGAGAGARAEGDHTDGSGAPGAEGGRGVDVGGDTHGLADVDATAKAGGAAVPSPDEPFVTIEGQRWLRTPDAGQWHQGRLHVLGRLDDVVVTGGMNVHPGPLERTLGALPEVGDVVVVGVPDAQWGHLLTAVVRPAGTTTGSGRAPVPDLARVRDVVRSAVGSGASLPRALVFLEEVPLRGPGKIDRIETARRAAAALVAGRGERHPD